MRLAQFKEFINDATESLVVLGNIVAVSTTVDSTEECSPCKDKKKIICEVP